MGKKNRRKKNKGPKKPPPHGTLGELDAEEITTMRIEHPLQVLRGFKDKITDDPKKRKRLIKGVALALLDHSFLPYADQYSDNVATFLGQLTEDEISTFYKQFDETFGAIVGEYENIIASMFKNKLQWKKALVKEEKVSAQILSALFGKKKKDEVEETPEAEGTADPEESSGENSKDSSESEGSPEQGSGDTEVPEGTGQTSCEAGTCSTAGST